MIDPREAGLLEQLCGAPGPAQRRAMAKAITLLESTRADHREQADGLLTALLPHTGKSFRLGISGVPGVGKSTFIEALGLHLIAPILDGPSPALLIGEHGRGNGGSQRRDQHREEDRRAANATHRNASHRSTLCPSPSVSATLSARGTGISPSIGQRSRHTPSPSR